MFDKLSFLCGASFTLCLVIVINFILDMRTPEGRAKWFEECNADETEAEGGADGDC